MDANRTYPLADVIRVLGRELREAQSRARVDGEPDLLKLKECTVELGITWEKVGETGIDIKIFKLGGNISKENTETMTVTLEPIGDVPIALTE